MHMHGHELFTMPRGPFVSRFKCTKGLECMLLVCVVSSICIFKMYIIHMADAAPFISMPLMSVLNPIPHPHHFTPPTPPWLTNVQFDAAYFISLSPNTGCWLTWSLAGEVAALCLNFFFFFLPHSLPPRPPSSPPQSLLWRQQQSMHCIGGLKHCVWFPADKLTSGDLLTANSTEADTELGAWRQPERGRRVLGKVRGERGRGGRGVCAQTDRETDRWKKRRRESFNVAKQEAGRDAERKRSIRGGRIHTPDLVWFRIFVFLVER